MKGWSPLTGEKTKTQGHTVHYAAGPDLTLPRLGLLALHATQIPGYALEEIGLKPHLPGLP